MSAAGTQAWLRAALTRRPAARLEVAGHERAAILVPLLDGPDGLSLLLTVRSPYLSRHAGQVAFPGGRVEPGEDDVAAALRETREEVGLELSPQAICGCLDEHASPFGLVAAPVVACVPWPAALRLQASEVSEAFVVPLVTLRAVRPSVEVRPTPLGPRRLYGYDVAGRRIWGLTGNVVRDLLSRLAAAEVAA